MKQDDHGREQARLQYESIAQMVAALDLDFDELEELREARKAHGEVGSLGDWAQAYPKDAANLAEMEKVLEGTDWGSHEDVEQAIQDDPLEVTVRGGWREPSTTDEGAEDFQILLCTGGPAVRIMGTLDRYGEPARAWLEYQDWGTPWTEYCGDVSMDTLLTYCHQFYFGE